MKNLFVLLPIFALLLTGCQSFDRIESTSFSQQHQQPRIQPSPTPCPQDGMLCPDQTTIIYRHADTCQVDKSDCPYPNVILDPDWKSFNSGSIDAQVSFPPRWKVTEKINDEGDPFVVLIPKNTTEIDQAYGTEEIIFWSGADSPFSTSGALCANTECIEMSPVSIATMGEWYESPLIYAHHPTESSLDYFRFEISPSNSQYRIFVTITDTNQLPEIKQILLSLQPRAL